jgi:hypothetical protein
LENSRWQHRWFDALFMQSPVRAVDEDEALFQSFDTKIGNRM